MVARLQTALILRMPERPSRRNYAMEIVVLVRNGLHCALYALYHLAGEYLTEQQKRTPKT